MNNNELHLEGSEFTAKSLRTTNTAKSSSMFLFCLLELFLKQVDVVVLVVEVWAGVIRQLEVVARM